jgi:4-hydroxy-2-oxoheptanedioate aldolase
VRVPSPSSDLIGWALDAGAVGVVVPRVESVADAAHAEAATRFAAARGAAPTARAADYGSAEGYLAAADDHRVLVVQIETARALEQVGQIAALDGVDVLFLGPADLARSLQVVGGPLHPDLLAAAKRIESAARHAGKAAGVYLHDPSSATAYQDLGFTFVSSGFDSSLLADAARLRIEGLRSAVAGGAPTALAAPAAT